MAIKPWRAIPGRALLWALNLFSAVALIFEGYNQGVMGFVNGVPDYIDTVGIGANGKVTDTAKQGGLVAIYYFGAMFGCFMGGRFGDKYGRKKAVVVGSLFVVVGGALQAASQNSNMTLVARVICGLGIGFINSVSSPTAAFNNEL
jgi:MFS family permease